MLARDGGMNVPNISQVPGSVTTLPRTVVASDAVAPQPASAGEIGRAGHVSPTANVSFARLAWFDVNGDGEIDPRSASAGGDATLLVSSYAVDLPTFAHRANPAILGTPHQSKAPGELRSEPTPGVNPAQANRAVEAYQRYGEAPPPSAPVTGPAPTPAAGAPTTAPVVTPAPSTPPLSAGAGATDLTPNTAAAPDRAA